MMTNSTQHEGLLTIAPSGYTEWTSPREASVARIDVLVAGAKFTVEAADPTVVLGWTVESPEGLGVLAAAFVDPVFLDRVKARVALGGESVLPAPELNAAWLRRAVVSAVDTCTVTPLHEGALHLDRALADFETHNAPSAFRRFAFGVETLVGLARQMIAGELTGAAVDELTTILRAARTVLAQTGWASELASLEQQLTGVSVLSDDDLAQQLEAWAEEAARSIRERDGRLVGAGHLGLGELGQVTGFSDPTCVPARVIAWEGALGKDIVVEYDSAASEAVVTATLAPGLDPRSIEAQSLFAFVGEPATGRILDSAPMSTTNTSLVATLKIEGDIESLHFGIFDADTEFERVRADSLTVSLIPVERLVREAYSKHRAALALEPASPVRADDIEQAIDMRTRLFEDAYRAASEAVKILHGLARSQDDDDLCELLNARKETVGAYRNQLLIAPTSVSMHEVRPLLSELLVPERWDADVEEEEDQLDWDDFDE